MKTTINVAVEMYREAMKAATDRRLTFSEFLQVAIRRELAGKTKHAFKLEDCSFKGQSALQPGADLAG
jgi:hypothetical protein